MILVDKKYKGLHASAVAIREIDGIRECCNVGSDIAKEHLNGEWGDPIKDKHAFLDWCMLDAASHSNLWRRSE